MYTTSTASNYIFTLFLFAFSCFMGNDLCNAQTTFALQQTINGSATDAKSVYATDLDGDGDKDVVFASRGNNTIAWHQNNGSGIFAPQQIISTNANNASAVYATDLDGDGDNDVLSASENDNKIAWYRNNGTGTFSAELIISTNAAGAAAVYATDLDGDGDNDVISASTLDGKVAWYTNNGTGIFSTEQVISATAWSTTSVYATDLDGDGDNDVVLAAEGDQKIAWYRNNGSGTFGAELIINANAVGVVSIYATDLDGDGDKDVVSASYSNNRISWYRNNGTGAFGAEQIIGTNVNGAVTVYATDLDGDGDNDVIAGAQIIDKIVWYENNGSGTFSSEQLISNQAFYTTSVYATDLDGDGDNDVLSSSEFDNKVAWYQNLLVLYVNGYMNNPPCIGANNGSVLIQASGLVNAPYTYQWTITGNANTGSGVGTTDNFVINNLAAGTYQVTVTNAIGIAGTTTVIVSPTLGSFFEITDINTTNSSNNLPNGAIQITVDGGTAPYIFAWSGAGSGSYSANLPTYNIANLFGGNYTVTITDANNHTLNYAVSLADETQPPSACNTPLDIVILNDVSASVDEVEYSEAKQFFVNFINELNIGTAPTDSRVAVIEWADNTEQQVRIPITGDLAALQNYTNYTRVFNGGTNPNAALTYGYNYLEAEARAGITKILILSTDAYANQISGSLIAVAEAYKAQGYIIVSIAFEDAFNDSYTRNILTQAASVPLLAPGANSYAQLSNELANGIVNLYVCPADPGSSNTYYFNRDGVLDIVSYTINGACPTPQSITLNCVISA